MELHDGKLPINMESLSVDELAYINQFREELNAKIAEETEKAKKEIERSRTGGGKSLMDDPTQMFAANRFKQALVGGTNKK